MPQNSNFSFEPTKTFFVGEKVEGKLCFTAPEDYTKLLEGTISVTGIITLHGNSFIQEEKHKFFSGKMRLNLHKPEQKKRLVLKDGKKVKWRYLFLMPDTLPSSFKHKTVECAYYLEASLTTSTHKKPYNSTHRISLLRRANPDDYVPETLCHSHHSAKDVVIRCTPDHACYYPNQTGTVNISIDNPSGKVIEKVTSSLVCKCRFQRNASLAFGDKTKFDSTWLTHPNTTLPLLQTETGKPATLTYHFTIPLLAVHSSSCSSQYFKNYWYLKLEFHIQHHLNIKVKVPIYIVGSQDSILPPPTNEKEDNPKVVSEDSRVTQSQKKLQNDMDLPDEHQTGKPNPFVIHTTTPKNNQDLQELFQTQKAATLVPLPDLIEFSPKQQVWTDFSDSL